MYDQDTDSIQPAAVVLAKREAARRGKPSELPFPAVIGTMPPIKSMINGRMYDDKASYYRHVARAGCEIVGFDKNWTDHVAKPGQTDAQHEADIVGDIKKSIEQLNSGTAEPLPHAG